MAKQRAIVSNTSDKVGEFSLCYLEEGDLQFFATITERNTFLPSQRAQDPTPIDLLKDMALEETHRLYFGL